jgi:NADH-quinone oxidoreductase subunit M
VPNMAGITMIFALASLGLPGMANFVGEFLVLAGSYRAHPWIVAPAAAGIVFSAVYSLWMMYRVFFGIRSVDWKIPDLSLRETGVMAAMIAAILWVGMFPQSILNTAAPALAAVTKPASTKSAECPLDRAPVPAKLWAGTVLGHGDDIGGGR